MSKTGRLVYITLPEEIFDYGFFDPAIPLPVELPAEIDPGDKGFFNTKALNVEMILSGMLLELAENPEGEHSAYYRRILLAFWGQNLEDPLQNNDFCEAVSLIQSGNEEQGIQSIKRFLERKPGAGKGWFVLGWGLRRLSRWKEGLACFEKAIEFDCANPDTYNELAICRMEMGDLQGAERELKKALQLQPDNVKIISNRGFLALKQGNNEKALAFFRTVLELDPDDPVAAEFSFGSLV